ncbi:hypothetical protein ACMU_10730 [Actibacterium mucosum KCTC 23349]|uniref:Tetratricopeptide repeat protein 38 n=1 Tax=Actibacterium mucosum KCTC 23349 TaxID=1454373 RepID=A0A037ZKQ5_9RHOB|nr:tetratricopeptide repeat protein [Actibacterium mucosum]KAJ56219.1 hypothetical protein ACMU_10730 [Actibacterium mucosum KCTC 23349]
MATDIFGGEVTANGPEALESWNKTILAFLAHGADTPTHLMRAIELDPGFVMAHATKGLMFLMLGKRELFDIARESLTNAKLARAEGGATAREVAYVNALQSWLDGNPAGSVTEIEKVLLANPGDTLSMKVSHAIRFILGDAQGMLRSVLRVEQAHGADHPGRGYLLGCQAFALEENGEYVRAEVVGREGLTLTADDAWGLHAVAHVLDMTAQARAGIDLLDANESKWQHCNNFRYHVWWHKALLHLDQGEVDKVFALYDQKIRFDQTDDYRDISNATSLLSRLELEGHDVGARWEELAEFAEARSDDGVLVFADLHYMLALIGGERETAKTQMLARMHRDASRNAVSQDEIFNHPGLAAAEGLAAFGEGRYDNAFLNLLRAREAMQSIGGSHAQRDVFERITIDAGIRAGRLDQATDVLDSRKDKRKGAEDRFTATRYDTIARAKQALSDIPAQ